MIIQPTDLLDHDPNVPCMVCGKVLASSNTITCHFCNAVTYCSEECLDVDLSSAVNVDHSHQRWCDLMKHFMEIEAILFIPSLSFSRTTAHRNFTRESLRRFLSKLGIVNVGLWKYEFLSCISSPAESNNIIPGSELSRFRDLLDVYLQEGDENPAGNLSYNLAVVNAFAITPATSILCYRPGLATSISHESTLVIIELEDWGSYYRWRGLSLPDTESAYSSPIALLMHWPLTVYFILYRLLPIISPRTISSVINRTSLVIHVIGVEHELSVLPVFKELDYLLRPDLVISLLFIGPNLDPSLDGRVFQLSHRFSVTVQLGIYDELTTWVDTPPDLVIGFNAGLAAYPSWPSTLQLLSSLRAPCFFTDSCPYSCAWGFEIVGRLNLVDRGPLSMEDLVPARDLRNFTGHQPILNPFRSPIRMESAGVRWGWFKNAYVYMPFFTPSRDSIALGDTKTLEQAK